MQIANVTYRGAEIADAATFECLPQSLKGLLSSLNGFIQYGGGLHVRGAVHEPSWHSIADVWTGALALSKLYAEVLQTDVPFAQDCVGDQFLLRDNQVWLLSAETGQVENLELGLKSFFVACANKPIEFLGMEPLLQLQREGKSLQPGQLIHAYPPFCTKEAANGVSLKAVPASELIGFHAELATQLPLEGEQFEVRWEE